jgi:hypothetical protein
VNGTNFESDSVIEVNGAKETTTYVSSTQLKANIPANQVASGAQLQVRVLNGTVASGTSNGNDITVTNPAPVIVSLTPGTIDKTFPPTIIVTGTGFVPTTVLQLNGSARQTSFVNSTKANLTLTPADLNTPGTDAITAVNSAPGGGTSKAVNLIVSATPLPPPPPTTPTLSVTGVFPTQFYVGTGDSTIFVDGTGFDTTSIVNWNGQPLTTSLNNQNQLYATVPAADFAQAGTASITVTSTTVKPSPSNAVSIQIVPPPAPKPTSVYPNSAPINTAPVTLTVNGSDFVPSTVVQWNGQNLATTFGGDSSLTAVVPVSLQTTLGNASVTVVTPSPGGGTSQAFPFTEYVGIISNSAVYNPVDGLLYLTIPSSVGAPLGNSVVSVDPVTGAIGQPIFVGSEPNQIAVSTDGKTLFVGLDAAGAVRQVDLPSRTASTQFSIGGGSGIYNSPATALTFAPLAGTSQSVAVGIGSTSIQGGNITIFDNGVARPKTEPIGYPSTAGQLAADPAGSAFYGIEYGSYSIYNYDSTGISSTKNVSLSIGALRLQYDNGRVYLDSGQVLDAASGSLLGSFYLSPNTLAQGPFVSDSTLKKDFVLADPSNYSFDTSYELQAFNESDFTLVNGATVPVNGVGMQFNGPASAISPLWRWGTNGLVFRASNGVFSFRTNIVQDLSKTQADLSVKLSTLGANTTGSNLTTTITVTNNGPQAATNVALTGSLGTAASVVSVNPSQGNCSAAQLFACNLGKLASGSTSTITLVLLPTTPGDLAQSFQVTANEADPDQSNNQANDTVTIATSAYEPAPVLTSISPNGAATGSSDTAITVSGQNFSPDSTILWNGAALPTTFVSSSQLSTTVSTTQLATYGWASITVSSPAGGVSQPLPFTLYKIVALNANRILYDPFSRQLYASVNSTASQVTGNTIVTIDPETGNIGKPVSVGSQPTVMALSDDGQVLYTILSGSNSLARVNTLAHSLDYTIAVPGATPITGTSSPRDIAVQPGTENTLAIDNGYESTLGLYDLDTTTHTLNLRGHTFGFSVGPSLAFLNSGNLFSFDSDDSGATFDHFLVSSAGLSGKDAYTPFESTLNGFGGGTPPIYKLDGGLAFGTAGGVANPATDPATQIGIYEPIGSSYTLSFFGGTPVAPDTSLNEVFFFGPGPTVNYNAPAGLVRYDEFSFLPTAFLPLGDLGSTASLSLGVDLTRWGSDGLAMLTVNSQIYLARGPFVVPQLLQQNPKPTLASVNITTASHGAGNLRITVTGSNLVPGATVNWNGAPRTTTRTDATHLSVAIPASDLAAAGTASVTITNPASAASNAATFTIN